MDVAQIVVDQMDVDQMSGHQFSHLKTSLVSVEIDRGNNFFDPSDFNSIL